MNNLKTLVKLLNENGIFNEFIDEGTEDECVKIKYQGEIYKVTISNILFELWHLNFDGMGWHEQGYYKKAELLIDYVKRHLHDKIKYGKAAFFKKIKKNNKKCYKK
jgi:hypothetical protein